MRGATQRLSVPWRGSTALCIGNGRSRLAHDLETYRAKGWKLIGCNGLYRDILPDALVAGDSDISLEIMLHCPSSVVRIVHQSLAGHPTDTCVPLNKEARNACSDSAGVMSVAAAICLGAAELVLIGHDLDGRPSVYHGTPNTSPGLPQVEGTVLPWKRTLESVLACFDGPVRSLTPTPLDVEQP